MPESIPQDLTTSTDQRGCERGGAGGADARAGGGPGRLHLHAAQPRVPRAPPPIPHRPAALRVAAASAVNVLPVPVAILKIPLQSASNH